MHNIKTENEFSATNDRRSEFAYVTQTTINEGIILKYRSFAGQTNPARLRMTKIWGLHSNDKSEKGAFSHSLTFCLPP